MKIGFLGGHKTGTSKSNIAEDYHSKDLEWEIKTEKPWQNTSSFQGTISISIGRDYIYYNLMILKKEGVMKFFYVLEGMSKEEIQSQIKEHWDKSDILGYDFD